VDNQRTPDLWTERLAAASADARKRLQRRSPGWWRDAAASGGTRADRVHALVTALATLDPTTAGRGAPERPERDPTLADQLTVVLHDLAAAAAEERQVDVEAALAELANGLRDVDPRR